MPCDNLKVAQSTINVFNKLKPRISHFNSLLKENDTLPLLGESLR